MRCANEDYLARRHERDDHVDESARREFGDATPRIVIEKQIHTSKLLKFAGGSTNAGRDDDGTDDRFYHQQIWCVKNFWFYE